MISAVVCIRLRRVWNQYNKLCAYAFFRLISITRYVLKSPKVCFRGKNIDKAKFGIKRVMGKLFVQTRPNMFFGRFWEIH